MAFSILVYPPSIPVLMKEFGISYFLASLPATLIAIPGILFSIPVGLSTEKSGVKKWGLVSLACIAIGSAAVFSAPNFTMVLLGRVLAGFGGLLFIIVPMALSDWFDAKSRALAMGVFVAAASLASAVVLSMAGSMVTLFGWRSTFLLMSLIATIVFLLFHRWMREAESPYENSILPNQSRGIWSRVRLDMWKLSFVWLFSNFGFSAFLTWYATFLVGVRGVELGLASVLAGMVMLSQVPVAPLMGWVSDRLGKRKMIIAFSFVAESILYGLSFVVEGMSTWIVVLTLGVFVGIVAGLIFALPREMFGAEEVGLSLGLMNAFLNVGTFAGPSVMGLVKDVTGEFATGFWIVSIFCALAAALTYLIKAK
jgi:NNP family nitrate/nitrite transporter-like MFS transporter